MAKTKTKETLGKRGHNIVKLEGRDNWYVDQVDGKLLYRKSIDKRPVKIYTEFTRDQFKKAQAFVDRELIKRFSQEPEKEKRRLEGILNPTIKELYDECVSKRTSKKAEGTNNNYDISWRHGLEPFWGNKTLSDLTQQSIVDYETWYVKNRSDRTFFNTRKCLLMLTNYLWDNGYFQNSDKVKKKLEVTKLDAEVLDYRRKKKKVGRRYTEVETEALIANATELRDRVAIKIFRFMGARKMEVLSSKVTQIDLLNRVYEFYSSKNKKWRQVPIPDVVYGDLKAYLATNKSEYVFPGITNLKIHITPQWFDQSWTKIKKKAGISKWNVKNAARIHDLRHTFATDTAEQGWPVRVACDILDMSIEEYERTYSNHISKDIKSSLMKKGFAQWK